MISSEHIRCLEETARECGAISATPISTRSIVIENRTVLKCVFGCNGYGSKVCPPYIPSVDEFRNMLSDYEWALLVQWRSQLHFTRDISKNFTKYGVTPPEDPLARERHRDIVRQILRERAEVIQPGSLEIEKRAWTLGYNTALATFPGRCAWCSTNEYDAVNCAKETEPCHHPTKRRPCLMGLGIRLDKTLEALDKPLPPFPLNGTESQVYNIILLD